jgi:CBS domain containing-hemolysin-like protein
MIISKLGYVPNEQEKFTIGNYRYEIITRQNHQIKLVKIKKLS